MTSVASDMSFPQPNVHELSDIHAYYTLPGVFTYPQLDALVDIHGRSHNFPLIHPREVLLAGHWVTTQPLFSCGTILPSLPLEVGLHRVGLVCLSHAWSDIYTQEQCQPLIAMRKSQFWWRMCDCLHWSSHLVGGDICHNLTHHLTCLIFPPIPNLPLSLKGISLH